MYEFYFLLVYNKFLRINTDFLPCRADAVCVGVLKAAAGLHAHRQLHFMHANQQDTYSVPFRLKVLASGRQRSYKGGRTVLVAWLAGCPTSCSFSRSISICLTAAGDNASVGMPTEKRQSILE